MLDFYPQWGNINPPGVSSRRRKFVAWCSGTRLELRRTEAESRLLPSGQTPGRAVPTQKFVAQVANILMQRKKFNPPGVSSRRCTCFQTSYCLLFHLIMAKPRRLCPNVTPVETERYLAPIAQPHFSNNSLASAHSSYNANLLHRTAHQKDLIYQVQKPRPVILSVYPDLPAFYFDLINPISLWGHEAKNSPLVSDEDSIFGPNVAARSLVKSGVGWAEVYNCPPHSIRISPYHFLKNIYIRVDDPDLPAFYFIPLINSISSGSCNKEFTTHLSSGQ